LKDAARDRGFKTMEGITLPDNDKMLRFARKNGFKIYDVPGEDNIVHIQLRL
jgi:RimJ/RimL family protein N-acetyltransferase